MNNFSDSSTPLFLPPILDLRGEREPVLSLLYSIFCEDFKKKEVFCNCIKVVYDNQIKQDGEDKEEGFWHIITKDYNGERLIDFKRAEKLPWAKPLLCNINDSTVKHWRYNEGAKNKGIRFYIWLENHNYVIILQEKHKRNSLPCLFLITGFHVEEKKREELYKKYNKRIT